MTILRLAMPTPLRRSFDYLPPVDCSPEQVAELQAGRRVLAPFGSRQLVGVLLAVTDDSDIDPAQLKPATAIFNADTALPPVLTQLCQWASHYYQHPIGDVFANALPTLLRKPEQSGLVTEIFWQLSTAGKGLPEGALKRAKKQAELLALLQQQPRINSAALQAAGFNRSHLNSLIEKNLVTACEAPLAPPPVIRQPEAALTLNDEQQQALEAIAIDGDYQGYLLEGVTGSGKTEVYLQLIQRCLDQGLQALVLIPEIGLTPQTLSRFERRFNRTVATLHSGLTDRERLLTWQWAASGEADIIIGTRSAIFTPLAKLGLIIVDEEHDNSFKQQDGFRYHARDLAIKRGFDQHCPVVLGSATPSLETLHNALQGRYQHLHLTQRAGNARAAELQLIDIRHAAMQDGLSPTAIHAISQTIAAGQQALVFINRRGFAPVMLCHDCGFIAQCQHCDARLTVHFGQRRLRCHHCDSQWALPQHCPDCNSPQLDFRGAGTERSEQALQQLFPDTPVVRVDRDTTRGKQAMEQLVAVVNEGKPCILVGTQMLAKGHHFPAVTLVVIIDADGGLFSADFRGPERMGQLLLQVAGRAGRADKPGRVLLQTHQPEHPMIQCLSQQGYGPFAQQLLNERQQNGLPPYGYLALVRAEGKDLTQAEAFLAELRQRSEAAGQTQCFGPLPAPMARRAGYFRAQLLVQAANRSQLNRRVSAICQQAERHRLAQKLRWSIDVDPSDMF